MGGARPGLVRNTMGCLAVAAIVAFIAIGLPLIDRSMPANRPVAGDAPFTIGAAVTVIPPPGASVDVTRTRPGDTRGTALFLVQGVRLSVVTTPFRGDLGDAATRLRGKITKSSGYQVTGGERAVATDDGVPGVRGAYSSPGRLGEYAVFVHDGLSVEVTASGPEAQLRAQSSTLEDCLRSITFDGEPP